MDESWVGGGDGGPQWASGVGVAVGHVGQCPTHYPGGRIVCKCSVAASVIDQFKMASRVFVSRIIVGVLSVPRHPTVAALDVAISAPIYSCCGLGAAACALLFCVYTDAADSVKPIPATRADAGLSA